MFLHVSETPEYGMGAGERLQLSVQNVFCYHETHVLQPCCWASNQLSLGIYQYCNWRLNHLLIQQIYIRHLLCARDFSRARAHNREQNKTPVLMERMLKWRQEDSTPDKEVNYNIEYVGW